MLPGTALELEIRPDFTGQAETWEQIFAGNPQGLNALIPLGGASYRALGHVVSIDPLVANCGMLSLPLPLSTHDPRVIGQAVGFTVFSLAGY